MAKNTITSFFSPKPKKMGNKRYLTSSNDDGGPINSSSECNAAKKVGDDGAAKRRIVSPEGDSIMTSFSSSLSRSSAFSSSEPEASNSQTEKMEKILTQETQELLSFLDFHDNHVAETRSENVPTWRNALQKQFATSKFTSLAKFVATERASKTVYPPPHLTFSALNLTPLHRVKVVIVGQDPYHQPQQGHGLSFSVPPNVAIPPSLRNIYKELLNDKNVAEFTSIPNHGNLERWAKQGVLLLNNVLTVRRGEAGSHGKKGWEEFTDGVIGAVIERDSIGQGSNNNGDNSDRNESSESDKGDSPEKGSGVVFLLWGKPASVKAQTVLARFSNTKRGKHAVICCSHPSPLGATKTSSPFMGSRCFSRANEELAKRGWKPIDWRVDGALE